MPKPKRPEKTQIAFINALLDLIEELVDPDDCWFDHHGNCQAHGCISQPCVMQRAKEIVDKGFDADWQTW